MNDSLIEKLLSQAPCPTPPPGLGERLAADIRLPAQGHTRSMDVGGWKNPLRRWMPALAFGLFLLSCVVLIGMQANWLVQLKHTNESLREKASALPQLQQRYAKAEQQRIQLAELEQLRKDNQDLQQLRKDVEQLKAQAGEVSRLRTENSRLTSASTSAPVTGERFFAEAQAEADRIRCVNNLKQIGLAIRVWGGDNQDRTPTSYMVMSNELNTVKILICPSDAARQRFSSTPWNQFDQSMSSYELRTTGGEDERWPESIITKCPIHHNYGLADGSVQSVNPENFREVTVDGRTYLKPIGNPVSGRSP